MAIGEAAFNDHDAIEGLLVAAGLPVPDQDDGPVRFLVDGTGSELTGCAGWERYGAAAVVRSVAVDRGRRGQGLGRALVEALVGRLGEEGVHEAFLLTNDAAGFFAELGFVPIARLAVPPAVAASRLWAAAGCAGAQAMRREVAGPAVHHRLTILAVAEVRRAVEFYTRAFGWRQVVDVPVYAELALPRAGRLGLYERTSFGVNTGAVPQAIPPGALSPAELYLFPDDLEGTLGRVVAAGGRVLSPLAKRLWGDETAYFADPDGHVVALARELDDPD